LIAAKYLDKNAATLAASGCSAARGPIATAVACLDDADDAGDAGADVAGPDDPDSDAVGDADEFSTGAKAAVWAGAGLRCCWLATA
jgi:hypothetical protein